MERTFRKRLLDWYARVQRQLPWRTTKDPYAIWISEVMLQQTRVATVLPYYERWLGRFPTVTSLAETSEDEVLKLWSGLGYYSRARNLHRGAQQVEDRFPNTYESIRELAGVGDYTAAAIASIAFGHPHPAVDGNVLRVMSRVTNDSGDISSSGTRRRLTDAASNLLDRKRPGDFNQAMMELGATVCLPKQPQCVICPVSALCQAQKLGTQNELPIKLRRIEPKKIERTLLIIRRRRQILFWQRPKNDRKLGGFWELPEPKHIPDASNGRTYGEFRHSVTNHNYKFTVCEAFVNSGLEGLRWLRPSPLQYLFSTATRKALHLAGVKGFEKGSGGSNS